MPKSVDSSVGTTALLSYLYLKILSSESAILRRGPRRSEGSSLQPSGIQKLIAAGLLSSRPKYSAILRHCMPCSIQNLRTFASGLESVSPSAARGCEKNVGLKSSFTPVFFAHFTHGSKFFSESLLRSVTLPSWMP